MWGYAQLLDLQRTRSLEYFRWHLFWSRKYSNERDLSLGYFCDEKRQQRKYSNERRSLPTLQFNPLLHCANCSLVRQHNISPIGQIWRLHRQSHARIRCVRVVIFDRPVAHEVNAGAQWLREGRRFALTLRLTGKVRCNAVVGDEKPVEPICNLTPSIGDQKFTRDSTVVIGSQDVPP